jgi:hypothetical protein
VEQHDAEAVEVVVAAEEAAAAMPEPPVQAAEAAIPAEALEVATTGVAEPKAAAMPGAVEAARAALPQQRPWRARRNQGIPISKVERRVRIAGISS